MTNLILDWVDYVVFIIMICFGSLIGIYMSYFNEKPTTAKEYFLGGKSMKVIPVGMSLEATLISGLTLLSIPADVYRFGGNYIWSCISMGLVVLVMSYVFLPVFLKLDITSTYEYLEKRFDYKTRQLASFLYGISQFLYIPIVIYIPSIAFSAVTNTDFHYIVIIVCVVCVFYTAAGGLKVVIWTDALQLLVLIGSFVVILLLGIISNGGFLAVWNKSLEGQRLDIFNFSFDPTEKDTIPIILIGLTTHWISQIAVNQSFVQKLMALPSLKYARRSATLFLLIHCLLTIVFVLTGLVIFTRYATCDPIKSKLIKKNDELVPFYVMDIAGYLPGLPGLFLAGIFSAALSSFSSDLNCVSATIYEDFVLKLLDKQMQGKWNIFIFKTIVVISGTIMGVSALLVSRMGGMWPLAFAAVGISTGPILGMCTCGVLLPRTNSKGVFYGSLVALVFVTAIVIMTKYYEFIKAVSLHPTKPLSTKSCHLHYNTSITHEQPISTMSLNEQPFFLFRLSHYYVALVGALITVIASCTISYFTKENNKPVARNLLSPIIYFLLPNQPGKNASDEQDTHLKLLE